ncbi:MAG TPA: ATP-dependent helicase HrpB [Chthoniobacterales bacterium]|jgi:ATP-dependent helicase HrpB
MTLPIYEIADAIVAAARRPKARLLVHAPTGSGKSTQIPQILHRAGLTETGQIVLLQPRRLAARMLADRVASEMSVKTGSLVGYQIRLENRTSEQTRIRFVTEGILLRQMIHDPHLRGIQVVVFDEFHERHLYGDITLARALDLQETTRPDLVIVVMSATLETGKLEDYLSPCDVLTSEGRMHPVDIHYLDKPVGPDYPIWDLAADELDKLLAKTTGDALVFMPGAYEIQRTIEAIRRTSRGVLVLPLHGELPAADQDAAVSKHDTRKVVVSTNVAETSLTIDGITIVVDAGLARVAKFDPQRGINTLLVEKISRSSADQRAGRAGRTAPGRCLRLWTSHEHTLRAPQDLPEVKRLDLSEVVLTLKAGDVRNIQDFRWLEKPDARGLQRAEDLLVDLGAVDRAEQTITPLGRRMLAFPVHPRYARMFLMAQELGCVRGCALLAAMTQGRGILLRSQGRKMDDLRDDILGSEAESDFFLAIRAWRYAVKAGPDRSKQLGIHYATARQIQQLFDQFLRIAADEKLDVSESPMNGEALAKCLLAGFSDQVARRMDSGTLQCELVHARRGVLARESVVQKHPLLVIGEIREIEGRDKELNTLLTLATAIQEDWLRELFPADFSESTIARFDPIQRRVIAETSRRFRDLTLEKPKAGVPPPGDAARVLAEEVVAGRLVLENWDHAVEQWIIRLNRLAEWAPDFGLPPLTLEDRTTLVEQLCLGAMGYKDIKEKSVWPTVKSWLSRSQLELLDTHAPEKIDLPGLAKPRAIKLVYAETGPPTLAARIQDLFGVERDLTVCMGRVPVLIQVLAPNHRPVQVTQSLTTFWKESYPVLKQQLQRKYPRHEWR